LARAKAAVAAGKLADAAGDLDAVIHSVPTLAAAHALRGEVELRRRNFNAASAAYARALELDPASFDALRGRVALDLLEQRHAAALASVERRLAATPDDAAVLMLAASLYQATGAPDRRAAALRRVVEVDPGNPTAFVALLGLYVDEGRLGQAFSEYEQLARAPAAAGAETMLGLILEAQRKPIEARAAYEKALVSSARSAVAANNLAWLLVQRAESREDALQLALTATRLQPDSAAFHDTLGWIYLEKGLPEAALPPLEFSVATAPADPQYRYHLSLAYAQTGATDKATRELLEVLKLKPGYANAEQALRALRPASLP
jgi:tetratricopeptide (TPR) repeat protein